MIFRMKTQGPAFIVVPSSDLVEGIVFGNTVFLQGEILRSSIGQRQRSLIVSFLELLLLENLLCSMDPVFVVVTMLLPRVIDHHGMVFFSLFFYSWVCASWMFLNILLM